MTYVALSGEPVGDAGDIYTGLDRFNRVVDVRWINASNTDINRFKYTFSRASNRLTRQNVVASSGGFDEQYLYDNLYEVTTRLQGTLSGGVITGTPVEEEDFTFDPTGNWPGYVIKESGTITLNQTRAHQTANEITSISPAGSVGYDGNGNMTTMPEVVNWSAPQTVTYDAWNRPITVVQSGTTLGTYQYDGLNRRIWKISIEGRSSVTRHFYYSDKWQVLEERTGTSTSADKQYVWGTRYIDDLVLRDSFSGVSGRMYALADYFQPTAIADITGTVQVRYVYRAFGDVSFYTGSFSPISSSAYGWEYLFGSYYYDVETSLYQVRYRYYHSSLGRWLSRDPLLNAELSQGANLYWYVSNNAVNKVDPKGLAGFSPCVCGPDVTQQLKDLVKKVLSVWSGWSKDQQTAACAGLTSNTPDPAEGNNPAWLNAWDIDQLFVNHPGSKWMNQSPYTPKCTTSPACVNTVTVDNKCFYAGSVNYVLFGQITKLCNWSSYSTDFRIWEYKGSIPLFRKQSPNYGPSTDWANAGYDGWPSAPTPNADRPKCSTSCSVPYQGGPFTFYWYPSGDH